MTASRNEHSFGLDLVRCTAILLVLACHCGLAFHSWFLVDRPGYLEALGYYGVELFFVLSGFLIGRILLGMIAAQPTRHDWFVFMARRWIRTLPLYLVWLAILAAVWPEGWTHDDWANTWRLLPWYLWFAQSLAWPPDDWFVVSWSLAIEEWFYLTFSLLLFTCRRALAVRPAISVTLAIFLMLPLLYRLQQSSGENWNEYLHKAVVFRLDAIAWGVMVAVLLQAGALGIGVRLVLFAAGAVMIALQANGTIPLDGTVVARAFGFDVTDIGFALLLPAAAAIPRPWRWVNEPIRLFAAQSFATYIMHYTILEWVGLVRGRTHWDGLTCSLLASGLILVVPAMSWRWFEKPLLTLRPTARVTSVPGSQSRPVVRPSPGMTG